MVLNRNFPLYFILTVCLSLMGVMQAKLIFNCDVSWLMLAVRRWLAGGMYSSDFFETNPPLILFIYAPPVIVSQLFSLSIVALAKGYLVSLCLLSFAVAYPLIKMLFRENSLFGHGFACLLLYVYLCVPGAEFGQREHLIILFCVPYFLSIAAIGQGCALTRKQAVMIGVMAGIGFAIKPFYLLTLLLVESYLALKKPRRWLRVETVCMLAVMLVYAIVVLLFFRDYIFFMIPFVSRYYYDGYSFGLYRILFVSFTYFAAVSFIIFIAQKPARNASLSTVLLIAFASFFAVYLGQMSFTYYKLLPVLSIWLLLSGLQVTRYLHDANRSSYFKLHLFTAVLIAVMLYGCGYGVWVNIVDPTTLCLYFGAFAFFISYYLRRHDRLGFVTALASTVLVVGGGIISADFFILGDLSSHRFILTVLMVCLYFMAVLPRELKHKKDFVLVLLLSFLLFAFPMNYLCFFYHSQAAYAEERMTVSRYLQKEARHKPVYIFSTETFYTFPVLDYADLKNASRFPFFWMLPGMLKKEHDPEHALQVQRDKKRLINMAAEDIRRNQPEIILIDLNHHFLPPVAFNYIDYFFHDPVLMPLWRHYAYVQTIESDNFYNFAVYRRMPSRYAKK